MLDFVLGVAGAGRGQLIRVKPGGVALRSSAPVEEEVIQVSVRAKRSMQRDSARSEIAVNLRGFRR
jgi:hypothetical protein